MKIIRMFILLIALFLIFSIPSFAEEASFPDIENHWASESVSYLTQKKIISGREDGMFHPNDQVLANEYIKMVITALGYTDIQNYPGDWARNYIEKAKELGLIYDGEIENYYEPINRGMTAKIAMRALREEDVPDYIMAYKAFVTDYADLDANVREDILKCIAKGIIKGFPDGSFRPGNYLSRAEAAVVIHRMLNNEEREKAKPIFAEPDPEFEAFMASKESEKYCTVEYIGKVVDGKVIFVDTTIKREEMLLSNFHNPYINKEVYELLKELVMYAKEHGHFVKAKASDDGSFVFISYYENNRLPYGYYGRQNAAFEVIFCVHPYKYNDELREYTYYTWTVSNLLFISTDIEEWEKVNYREPVLTGILETAFKTVYGEDLGKKVFDFAIGEYDKENEYWFKYGEDYYNVFMEYREDLENLEVYNNNGSPQSMIVKFSTNKIFK